MGLATVSLMVITIISKITGLAREIIFGAAFGTDIVKDVYVISDSITAVLFSFLFMSIQSTFIPIYNGVRAEKGRKEADRFTANLTNHLIIIGIIMIILAFIFMEPIVSVIARGFEGEKFDLTVSFSRIGIFNILIMAMSVCMIGYLNIYNNFVVPATTGIIMNIVLILAAVLAAKLNKPYFLAYGGVAASAIKYIFFPGSLSKVGYRHRFILDTKDESLKKALFIAIPIMFSVVVNDLAIIIDKTIATTVASAGGVSALDYGVKILQLIDGVIVISIVTVAYPKMSNLAQKKEMARFKNLIASSMVLCFLLVIPAMVGLMLFVQPIVSLFYERGAFTAQSTIMTAGTLFWYGPGLFASVLLNFYNRAFYSIGNTKLPLIIAAIQVFTNIILNLILSSMMGLNGLALATTIGSFAGSSLLLLFLHRKIGSLRLRGSLVSILKIFFASAIMGIVCKLAYNALPFASSNLRFLAILPLAILVYGILILFMGIPEMRRTVNAAYHKMKR